MTEPTPPPELPEVPSGGPASVEAPALEPMESPAVAGSAPAVGARRSGWRSQLYLRGRSIHLPHSRRGIFALLLVLGGLGGVATFAGVSVLTWTETADFCGRCHSMEPELAAYEAGPHRDVACAECHVEPGITGWIKAKLNGTRQLVEVVLGTFPQPIPPPDHSDLPAATDTCMKCHGLERTAFAGLRTRTQFAEDEDNTRQFVGLMVRPGGGDIFDVNRSVHWHVIRDVTYTTPDEDAASIDYVAATTEDGRIREFIAQDKISVVDDVGPDIEAITASEPARTMGCYDCHNRIGHAIPNPRTGVDYRLSTGDIDPTLPFIKREAMRLLWSSYPSDAIAEAEIDRLETFYEREYPDVAATKAAQIDQAISQIKTLYRLTATPEMKVTAQTYPDHLGHMDFPGCFRCHDGGHFLVENGTATKETIPSGCETCHTFPQLGPAVASLPLGEPPSTHEEELYVFNHKDVATDVDPGGQSCGECHARDYCVNCHATGAVSVDHDTMATNHAKVIREQGNTACAYCHQPVYCARCHNEPVLPVTGPSLQGRAPDGTPALLAWPQPPPD